MPSSTLAATGSSRDQQPGRACLSGCDLEFPGHGPYTLDLSGLPCPTLVAELARALLAADQHQRPHRLAGDGQDLRIGHPPLRPRPRRRRLRRRRRPAAGGGGVRLLEPVPAPLRGRHPQSCSATSRPQRPGTLPAATAAQLDGVRLQPRPGSQPRLPFSAAETDRLVAACVARWWPTPSPAWPRPRNWWPGPPTEAGPPESTAGLAWLLDRRGPLNGGDLARLHGDGWEPARPNACPRSRPGCRDALFPTLEAALAWRLLVGLETGICPEGVDGLRADCLEWAGPGRGPHPLGQGPGVGRPRPTSSPAGACGHRAGSSSAGSPSAPGPGGWRPRPSAPGRHGRSRGAVAVLRGRPSPADQPHLLLGQPRGSVRGPDGSRDDRGRRCGSASGPCGRPSSPATTATGTERCASTPTTQPGSRATTTWPDPGPRRRWRRSSRPPSATPCARRPAAPLTVLDADELADLADDPAIAAARLA